MKIVIGADTYAPDINGASTFAQRLADALAGDHEVHVVCPSTDRRSYWIQVLAPIRTPSGVQVHRVPSVPVGIGRTGLRMCPQPWLDRSLEAWLREIRPDVVHVQGHFFIGRTMLSAAARLGIPTVATNHFMPGNLTDYLPVLQSGQRFVHRRAWRNAVRVLSRADAVTAPTAFAARLAEAYGVPGPVQTISCGLDLAVFAGGDRTSFRAKHGIVDKPTIGYSGRLTRAKNVQELLQALAILRYRLDAQLLLIGDGDEAKHLAHLARHLGIEDSVVTTGFVPNADLTSAYAAMDVFVDAGTAELQSLMTLEAMAAGLPVLGVDTGALPHLVHDGVNGYLIPHATPTVLAARLEPILRDDALRTRLGHASIRLAAEHDLRATVAAFTDVYERVTRGSARTVRHRLIA